MTQAEPTLEQIWDTLQAGNPSETIRPERSAPGTNPAVDALLGLAPSDAELDFGDTIGTGGMGVVRAAEQIRLGRTVAVKSLRDDVTDADAVRKLLGEAWTTGALEHPNIVPVYDIVVDGDRKPHIVMKRITGIEWESVMDDADAVAERFGIQDLLAWNLGILMAVCNALHFAHSRGVVHRDVKPQNVMIGAFGEVYLVDWGIAVSVDAAADPRIPSAGTGRIAGTPRYIAPEMAKCRDVSIRTDIYLLGGVLHRILTGSPPHRGWSVREILENVEHFEPRFGDDVPSELADLVRDAMAYAPSDRIDSAETFRVRLATFLAHRGSAHIADKAHTRLAALRAELASERPDRLAAYGHLGACRFGFQEALSTWPENAAARWGLQRAIEAVLRYELDQRDPRAARLLLRELPTPDPELEARVETLLAEVRAEEAAMRELKLDLDPRIGQRTRVFIFSVMGLFWVGSPLVAYGLGQQRNSEDEAVFSLFIFGSIASALIWGRESFFATKLNRVLAGLLLAFPVGKIIVHTSFLVAGGDHRLAMSMEMLVYALLSVSGALAVDRRFWPAVVTFGAGSYVIVLTAVPPLLILSLGSLVLVLNVLAIWLPDLPAGPVTRPRDDDAPP